MNPSTRQRRKEEGEEAARSLPDTTVVNGEEGAPPAAVATKPRSFFASPHADQAASGLLAGAMTTALLHPLDRVKILFQADSSVSPAGAKGGRRTTWRTLRTIASREGTRGLYAGLSPNFVGATLSWGLYFWWYAHLKEAWAGAARAPGETKRALGAKEHLLAAAGAGALTSLCTNPVWLVKTRMCLQPTDGTGRYRGVLHALATIAREEGPLALYRGLVPALLGVSHGAVQFACYEELKRRAAAHRALHNGRSYLDWREPAGNGGAAPTSVATAEHIVHAALSKLVAAAATYPYQLVKTRLQAQGAPPTAAAAGAEAAAVQQHPYGRTLRDVVRLTWQREGVRGFYKGLGANVARVMPGTCVTFVVYESASAFFKRHAT